MDELKEINKERTSRLLTTYPLSAFDISKLAKINNKTAISYKRMLRNPGKNTMLAIATTFGVSMDWLFGFSNIPYTEESLQIATNECYRKQGINTNYDNEDWEPEAKANLIVLQQYLNLLETTGIKKDKIAKIKKDIETIKETGTAIYQL